MNLIDPWAAGYVWGKYGDWGSYPYEFGDLFGNPLTDYGAPKAARYLLHPSKFLLYADGCLFGAMQIPHYLTNILDLRGSHV